VVRDVGCLIGTVGHVQVDEPNPLSRKPILIDSHRA
jgi:hypothetical protein